MGGGESKAAIASLASSFVGWILNTYSKSFLAKSLLPKLANALPRPQCAWGTLGFNVIAFVNSAIAFEICPKPIREFARFK
jgi:hypothetical protein